MDIRQYFFGPALFLTALFLILLVLVQRGRGGGLAGALGGMGGQSAFGTKAGDLFTRITMGVAGVWLLLCCLAIGCLNQVSSNPTQDEEAVSAGAGADSSPSTPDPESDN